MSQRPRVLAALKNAGTRGVTTWELRREYIANPSERIRELEAEGYVFKKEREKSQRSVGTRYTLVAGPDEAPRSDSPPGAGAPHAGLFPDDVGTTGPLSPYDVDAA